MGYQGETRYKLVEVHPQRSHKLQQASMDGAFIGAGSLYWTFIGLLAFFMAGGKGASKVEV